MKLILMYEVQKKIIEHCATGMRPSQYEGGVIHKLSFRIGVKDEINFDV